jgi:cytochrome c2
MKKKNLLVILIILSFSAVSLFGNPKLFREHMVRMKAGKKFIKSCSTCHNSTTGLKKMKGQSYKKIQKSKTCTGSGCHGK